jgi:alpha-glucoside transport system permease protein
VTTTPPVATPPIEQPPQQSRPPTGALPGNRALNAGVAIAIPILAIAVIGWAFTWMRTTEANRAVVVLVAVTVGVGAVFAFYFGMDRIVDLFTIRWQDRIRPWVFVGPALVLLGVFLVYPAVNTILISFRDATGETFVGWDNYAFVFSDPAMLRSIRNTLGWSIVVPLVATGVGLIFAVLADRLTRLESISKSLIFLPMAISFVGASVVWGFIYDFRVFGNQTGLLNGIMVALGRDPVAWLSWEPWNNLFLMVIMIWMQTGFAMVILSAAIKSVPDDLLEAGRIDGASELQIFRRITVPSIMSAIVVVLTTIIINTLKVFDIVWVLTNGGSGTEVIAERMIRWSFAFRNGGRGAAIAVILFLAVVPVMIMNVRRFRAEEEIR